MIQARLTMKLTVSFFDRGPSCPTDRARSFSFGFILFVLFTFIFGEFSVCSSLIAQQPSERFSLRSNIQFFAAQSTLFRVATTVFFLFFRCTHSGKVEQASMVLLGRPCHHKDADTREAPQASLAWPKFSWSSSAIWTIFTRSRTLSFDQPTLSGPRLPTQGLSVDSLFLISFLCWARDEEVEKGEGKGQTQI